MLFVFEDDHYVNKFGSDSQAFVVPADRRGYFNADDLSLSTVKHELWHIYIAELPIGSARLSKSQFEELTADLFADQGDNIVRQARKLFKSLKKELE